MRTAPLTVLLSLYKKESPDYLRASLKSIAAQTLQPQEVVMILDGPITDALEEALAESRSWLPQLHVYPQPTNQGLGPALAIGVKVAQHDLIARMDTDDIMRQDRLMLQYQQFVSNPQLAICGSNISEFVDEPSHVVGRRTVPESNEAIREFSKRRNPFNHMTVMFRRTAVLSAGNYRSVKSFEDYELWARMLKQGAEAYNIQDDLVFARTGGDMISRRGGWQYLKAGLVGRYRVYREGLGGLGDFVFVSGVHVVISLMPPKVREWFYQKKLRQ